MARFGVLLTNEYNGSPIIQIEYDGDLGHIIRAMQSSGAIVADMAVDKHTTREIALFRENVVFIEQLR